MKILWIKTEDYYEHGLSRSYLTWANGESKFPLATADAVGFTNSISRDTYFKRTLIRTNPSNYYEFKEEVKL